MINTVTAMTNSRQWRDWSSSQQCFGSLEFVEGRLGCAAQEGVACHCSSWVWNQQCCTPPSEWRRQWV